MIVFMLSLQCSFNAFQWNYWTFYQAILIAIDEASIFWFNLHQTPLQVVPVKPIFILIVKAEELQSKHLLAHLSFTAHQPPRSLAPSSLRPMNFSPSVLERLILELVAPQRPSSPFPHQSVSESKRSGPADSNQAGQQMETDPFLLLKMRNSHLNGRMDEGQNTNVCRGVAAMKHRTMQMHDSDSCQIKSPALYTPAIHPDRLLVTMNVAKISLNLNMAIFSFVML